MLRNMFIRIGLGALLAATLLAVSPATSQTATADELNIVPLSSTNTADTTLARSGGLVNFVRGITLHAAPGHRNGSVQLGLWHARDVGNGFKFEFMSHHGVPSNGNVPGMGREDSRCTKTVAYRYKSASRMTAAAAAIVILHRQNEASFRKYYRWQVRHHKVSKTLQARVKRINTTCKHHSPFHATMKTNDVYFGQVGAGTTSVIADHGLTAPAGLNVRTVGTGSSIFNAARQTNGRGHAGFSFRITSVDGGSAASTVTGPDATKADLLVTPDGRTRLLVNSYKTTTAANDRLQQKVLPKPTVNVACGYACNGKGHVKVKAKVPARAAMPVRFTARNAGVNHRWYVKPGRKRGTKFYATDASQVALSYCYVKHVNKPCASKTHDYAGTTEVVAPAWISYAESSHGLSASNGTTVSLTLTAAASTARFDRVWVILNGKTVQTLDLSSAAGSAPQAINIKKGRLQVKFTAYRNSDHTGALSTHYVYDRTFN
jgi:hypothetical protein